MKMKTVGTPAVFFIFFEKNRKYLLQNKKRTAIIIKRKCYDLRKVKTKRGEQMAKKSKIAKHQKQLALVEKYAQLRYELKQAGDYEALRKLPINSNPNRVKNRDMVDGRPRAYMRKFGISRIKFRDLAHKGLIPGVVKASW